MKAIKINNKIIKFSLVPLTLREVRPKCLNYRGLLDEEHYADGIREYVLPTLLENQKLGEDYFDEDNDVFTSYIVNKTAEDLELELEMAELDGTTSGKVSSITEEPIVKSNRFIRFITNIFK